MQQQLPILIAGGQGAILTTLERALRHRGYDVKVLSRDYPNFAAALDDVPDLVLVALPADGATGADLIGQVKSVVGAPPVIVLGVDDSVPGPATAYKLGVEDYVRSPDDTSRLLEALGLALGASRRDSELRYLRGRAAQDAGWEMLLGECGAMRETISRVKQIVERTAARSTAPPPILITGETGTGKGLLARCIHFNSVRRNEPFVDVNCATIPPNLMDSQLFGHERGAFTDARTQRPGLFETADGGSLFLDEIASLRLDLQAKILTAAEERRIRRIGARQSQQVDVQIIAATHRDLELMVRQGEFREDLFHRLNVLNVPIPPLRQRGEDKLLLADRFIDAVCSEYALPRRRMNGAAKRAVLDYSWPGNVRELRNQIERMVLLNDETEIRPEHFQFADHQAVEVRSSDSRGIEVELPPGGVSLEKLELEVLKKALAMNEGNVSKTARFLQISRQTLIYCLKKHSIPSGSSGAPSSNPG
jgi:two-component system NtrC family response regulator